LLLLFSITTNNKTTYQYNMDMKYIQQHVTGRSAERKEAMRLRRERELLEENAALRAALERKEQKELVLCEKFGLANTRISVLTSALMNSLHKQWKELAECKEPPRMGIAFMEYIMELHREMGKDNNVYTQAKLIELFNKIKDTIGAANGVGVH